MNNPTAGAIKHRRALDIAHTVFPTANEGVLTGILYRETGYPHEKSEARLLEDLETYKRESEGTVTMDNDFEQLAAFRLQRQIDAKRDSYKEARGITGWKEGDEPAEVTIRKLRDGDGGELLTKCNQLETENAALRAKCAEYETMLGVRLREIKAALEADDKGKAYNYE